jgi:hypothetical protein
MGSILPVDFSNVQIVVVSGGLRHKTHACAVEAAKLLINKLEQLPSVVLLKGPGENCSLSLVVLAANHVGNARPGPFFEPAEDAIPPNSRFQSLQVVPPRSLPQLPRSRQPCLGYRRGSTSVEIRSADLVSHLKSVEGRRTSLRCSPEIEIFLALAKSAAVSGVASSTRKF